MSTIEKAIGKFSEEQSDELLTGGDVESKSDGLPNVEDIIERTAAKAAEADGKTQTDMGDTLSEQDDSENSANHIMLDLNSLQAGGVVDPDAEHLSRIAEEFRRIKRPLLMHMAGAGASQVERPNMVMVTSSLAGEGKTFTSINLALSIAMEMDKTVLLVDADIAKPEVTKRLGVQAKAGLTDVLLGDDLCLQDVLIRTHIPNLSLLPAGRRHIRSTELLASVAMQELANEMSMRYSDRVIIFDSPPLLPTSEARVLAGLMGQILLVVEESRTLQPVVQEALSTIESSEIVGVVLNKSHRRFGGDLYGYGGYGYGYGYGHQ